jgi:hypothetical protein
MATRPPPKTLDDALERVKAKIKLKERFNGKRERIRNTIADWINYIRLYFEIKQNPYFTMFGLDKVDEIDDEVIKGIYVKNRQYIFDEEYGKKNIKERKMEIEQRDWFHHELKTYKTYHDRFKEQSDKNFNDRYDKYNPSQGDDSFRLYASKVVSEEWIDAIINLLSEYKVSPPPPNQQLEVTDIQNIITGILASPITTKNANSATNKMFNDIDLEFSKKLATMVLSDPESELGGRRDDEQQNMTVTAFLRDNRARQNPQHLRNKGLLTHTRTTYGGRQYKRRRKSSTIKHRRRRTSRK